MGLPPFDYLLLGFPVAAFLIGRRFGANRDAWWKSAGRCLALFALGLAASTPFLTRNAVGSGEAYNYDLALRDAVEQMRAGVIPPLVGQTQYAFNGRIHPLRSAPYLFYLGAGLDLVTRHRLDGWELQNLSVAFSLVAAFFAAYGGLRWGTGCRRPLAFFLAAAYGFSPALLAAAYSANLLMTVHAAPYVPLVLAACFRQSRQRDPPADALLAAALAAAWLAHPPVAYWLTVSAVAIRGLIFWRYPTWRTFWVLAGASLLFAALAGFVFASVQTMSASIGAFEQVSDFAASVLPVLRSAVPGALLPVAPSSTPATVADFQLGYVGWVLLIALTIVLWKAPRSMRRKPRLYCALAASLAVAGLLLALTLPVPGLTAWLWNHAPVSAQSITNIWILQRTYLVAMGLAIFAAAAVAPELRWSPKARALGWGAAALGLAWTAWEARPFIDRGMLSRWVPLETYRSMLPSNIDLTVTAYSFLETAPSYTNGVVDPQFEFRLLRNGQDEIDSPLQAALRDSPIEKSGVFPIIRLPGKPARVESVTLTLQPRQRYLISFSFLTPPIKGELDFVGPSLSRFYTLPSSGGPLGFGMASGNRNTLSLWTDQATPEIVSLQFNVQDWNGPAPPGGVFAGYALRRVNPATLPIRLESLLPLRFTVDAPEEGDTVETPRRWLPGYEASVIGRRLIPMRSPWHNVMVPVPKGHSEVVLTYPGAPVLRGAFWLSALAWLGFVCWGGARTAGFRPGRAAWERGRRTAGWGRRHWRPLAAAAAALAALGGAAVWYAAYQERLSAVGPIRLSFYLPFDRVGHVEPLITTGKTGAGTTLYLRYLEGNRLRIGADIWGGAWESDPIALNYFQRQELVLNSSGCYPVDNPAFGRLSSVDRSRLRGRFRVELNGKIVLNLPRSAYDSTPEQVVFGRNAIGSSVAEAEFTGQIIRVQRLPIPRQLAISSGQDLQLKMRFPKAPAGTTEPLLALGPGGQDGFFAVTYLPESRLRFSACSADGRMLESAERMVPPKSEHLVRFALAGPRAGNGEPAMVVDMDGTPLIHPDQSGPLNRPEELEVGWDPKPPDGVDARFTGPEETLTNPPTSEPSEGTGPLRLVVSFPTDRTGFREPLVTTGVTGKGDFLYVSYLDAHHVSFGYDHWGISGGIGQPVEIDYGRPHELVLSLGSLYPPPDDPAWGNRPRSVRQALATEFTVKLDHRQVFRASSPAWPSDPSDIRAGMNPIQGSSCQPEFTGLIFSADRLGLP